MLLAPEECREEPSVRRYLEGMVAAWKAGATSMNVNYRYVADELAYLLEDGRAAAVVGTLTSNYLLVVVELAELQRPPGAAPLEVIDLDGNAYFPCGCQDPLPWGPKFNRQRVRG